MQVVNFELSKKARSIENVKIIKASNIVCLEKSYSRKTKTSYLDVNDNKIAALIFGEGDKNIKHIEKLLLKDLCRGNILCITGKMQIRPKI